MSRNLLAEAFFNSDRTLAQRIEGTVRGVENRSRKEALVDVMDKLIYDAFVVFATKSDQLNNIKFLYDVTRFKYLCIQAKSSSCVTVNSEIKQEISDRCFQMLFSITADYVMLKGIREISIPKEMKKEIIDIVCEHLQMGTISHLVGIPSLGRFFEQRYNQLKNQIPNSKRKEIFSNLFDRLGYEELSPLKKIDKNMFNDLFNYVIEDVLVVYEKFGKDLMDFKQIIP